MEHTHLITQRDAAARITAHGLAMHESKLSILVAANAGPTPHSREAGATLYDVAEVDRWTVGQLYVQIVRLEDEAAGLRALIAAVQS